MKVPLNLKDYSRQALAPREWFSHSISISGASGVGTSTALKQLRQLFEKGDQVLPFRFVSGGTIMRQAAHAKGLTVEEWAAYNQAHPEAGHDHVCDATLAEFGSQNWTIMEARLAHIWSRHGFHVLLRCDLEERARRRWLQNKLLDRRRVLNNLRQRDEADRERLNRLYPNCWWSEEDDYDLIVFTDVVDPEATARFIFDKHRMWLGRRKVENSVILTASISPDVD